MAIEQNYTWDSIVNEHYQAIFAYAFQFTARRAEAEDVTQEVFLKAGQKLNTVRDSTKIRPWLYQIARNACIDRTRWYKRFLPGDPPEEAASDVHSDSFLGKELLQAIQQLPEKQREVFILRMLHDFSTHETAKVLKIQTGSVKSHLHRALEALKKNLSNSFSEMTTTDCPLPSLPLQGEFHE